MSVKICCNDMIEFSVEGEILYSEGKFQFLLYAWGGGSTLMENVKCCPWCSKKLELNTVLDGG